MTRWWARLIALVSVLGMLSACTPPPELVPYEGAVTRTETVFVATSRRDLGGDPPVFGKGRADALSYVEHRISIPPEREPGRIPVPAGRPDPERDYLAVGQERLANEAAFIAAINARLAALPAKDQHVFLFVHGYHTSYGGAVLAAAQVREDFGIDSPMVSYAWPSAHQPLLYLYDRDSVLFVRDQFATLLQALAKTRARSVVILAHSLGAELTMEGLGRLRDRGDQRTLNRIAAVVLAEPDIDLDVFRSQLRGLDLTRMAVAVLGSKRDGVLRLSSLLTGGQPRLGNPGDIAALRHLGVYALDISDFDNGAIDPHFTFQSSPDLLEMIRSGALIAALRNSDAGSQVTVPGPGDGDARAVVYLPDP